jgi:hypothetical protein
LNLRRLSNANVTRKAVGIGQKKRQSARDISRATTTTDYPGASVVKVRPSGNFAAGAGQGVKARATINATEKANIEAGISFRKNQQTTKATLPTAAPKIKGICVGVTCCSIV